MKLSIVVILLLVFSKLASATALSPTCERALVLSFSGDWPPYFFQLSAERFDGEDFRLLNRVLTAMQCRIAVLEMNERRTHRELQKGTFDLSVGASFTEQRAKDFYFSLPYRNETIGFAYRDKALHMSADITFAQALTAGATVAMNMNGYFGPMLAKLQQQFPTQFVHSFGLSERLQLLQNERVDIVVDDRHALCLKALEQTGQLWRVAPEVLYENGVHFIFNKRAVSTAWVDKFNHVLTTSKQSTQPSGLSWVQC